MSPTLLQLVGGICALATLQIMSIYLYIVLLPYQSGHVMQLFSYSVV